MKRKVVYDYKLMKSFAFVTQNWDVMKERYILFCVPFWEKRKDEEISFNEAYKKFNDISAINRTIERGCHSFFTAAMVTLVEHRSKEPITAWFHELDYYNRILTLQFLLVSASDLPDEIEDFEVEISPEKIFEKGKLDGGEVIGSKINGNDGKVNFTSPF